MKKTLVLVLSLLMVLSLASVASAGLNIVGGQFSIEYKIDLAEDKPIDGSSTGTVAGDARINLEGKYSNDNFVGYAYSRFDYKIKPTESVESGVPRWFMKKAEMDYIIADGFTLGAAYDQDDIKIHDEFVYGYKLKDFYPGTPLFSAKYAGDVVKVSNFNTVFTGGLFQNLIVAKADFGDAKVRGIFDMFQADGDDDDKVMGFGAVAEASYTFYDLTVGAGLELGKAAVDEAEMKIYDFKCAAEYYISGFTLTGIVRVDQNVVDGEDKFELGEVEAIVAYGNYELDTVIVPKEKIEPKLKLKKLAGTNNDLEIKATFGYDAEEKLEAPALNIKHIFKF